MEFRISFKSLKTSLFFLFILLFGYSAQAAQFTASLTVTSSGSEVVYDLKVKDNMYRIEKIKGLSFIPSMPTIHNSSTGISWGLNPQVKQYIEQTEPRKTMMMDPIAGWEFMRKKLEDTQTGTEMIEGYSCQVHEYRQYGDTRIANRVWVSTELGFILKEIQYALNGDVTLTLKNIKEDSVDQALFEIPPGYSKVVAKKSYRDKSTKRKAKKSLQDKKPLTKTFKVNRMSGRSISLKPDRYIIITATGSNSGKLVSSAKIKVLDKKNNKIIAEKITLKNGEVRTWKVSPDKEPSDISVDGQKGVITFKLDQLVDEPEEAMQTKNKKPLATSVDKRVVNTILIPQTLDEVKVLKSRAMASDKTPFMNGEVPLYDGAKIIKSKSYDNNVMAKLEVTATPEEVVEFYKETLLSKGWEQEMVLLHGNKGVLILKKPGKQLVIKVKENDVTSKIDMTIISQ